MVNRSLIPSCIQRHSCPDGLGRSIPQLLLPSLLQIAPPPHLPPSLCSLNHASVLCPSDHVLLSHSEWVSTGERHHPKQHQQGASYYLQLPTLQSYYHKTPVQVICLHRWVTYWQIQRPGSVFKYYSLLLSSPLQHACIYQAWATCSSSAHTISSIALMSNCDKWV